MKTSIHCISILVFIICLNPIPCMSEDDDSDDTVVLVAESTYKKRNKDSENIAKALVLFDAKYEAVVLSAKYLTHKGMLEHYGKKQKEIFCLAANEISVSVISERFYEKENSYHVKIKAKVRVTDFIHAEIKNLEMEKEESKFSYSEEMEQHVLKTIDPGPELSRAYRYIRKGKWRIAIIYLNHLKKKYPNWGDVYLAEAIGYFSIHNMDKMIDVLKTACLLDNQEACKDLQSLIPPHDKD